MSLETLKAIWQRNEKSQEWQENKIKELIADGTIKPEEVKQSKKPRVESAEKNLRLALRVEEALLFDLDLYIKKIYGQERARYRSDVIRQALEEFLKKHLASLGIIYGSQGQFTETKLKQLEKASFREYE